MSVRIAIVGNSFASHVQLPALRWANENGAPNEVIGIAGNDLPKAEETARKWGIPRATSRWPELLEESPDLVIITTPVHLHLPMVQVTLRSDAAILCEKPFTMDPAEARGLAEAAQGRLAVIDHQSRWSPWRRELKARIASGMAGTPWSSRITMRWGSPKRLRAPATWWYDAARGGGVLGALGSHMIDGLVDQFGSRVAAVTARLSTYVKHREGRNGGPVEVTADEAATLLCELEDGTFNDMNMDVMASASSRDAGGGNLIEYTGSRGTLRLEGGTELLWLPHDGEPEVVPVEALPTNEEMGMPEVGTFSRCMPSYLRDLVNATAEGATELPGAATFDDAVHVMEVIAAARRSSESGCRMDVANRS